MKNDEKYKEKDFERDYEILCMDEAWPDKIQKSQIEDTNCAVALYSLKI